jgi:AraC family transcriptional regulator
MERLRALTQDLPAGGGRFVLPRLAIGIFHEDQPTHRFALGGDRRSHRPLAHHQGWVLPEGSEGLCEYDADLHVTFVEFEASALEPLGLDARDPSLARVGALDPLLVHMALGAARFRDGPQLYRDSMEMAFAAHLAHVLRPTPAAEARIDDARLRRAVALVEERLAEDLSVADLARAAAMSEFHFSRAFRAATGLSPVQYVIAARMDRARVLLRTTRQSVAEIAWAVGYADQSRFGAHFKRAAGTTPAAFRAG